MLKENSESSLFLLTANQRWKTNILLVEQYFSLTIERLCVLNGLPLAPFPFRDIFLQPLHFISFSFVARLWCMYNTAQPWQYREHNVSSRHYPSALCYPSTSDGRTGCFSGIIDFFSVSIGRAFLMSRKEPEFNHLESSSLSAVHPISLLFHTLFFRRSKLVL